MGGIFGRSELQVIALSDRDDILAALRHALDSAGADSADRPGLERAVALVADAPAAAPAELRGRWARERIEAAGVEPKADSLVAVKALRKAEPALSLLAAVQLTKEAAASSPR